MNAETAKAIVQRYFHRLLNERHISICDEMLAPGYRDHDAPPGAPTGPETVKAFVTTFLDEYPDLHIQIQDILAEANKVAARILWKGTHRLDGTALHQVGIVIIHLNEQGQFVERWSAYTTGQ